MITVHGFTHLVTTFKNNLNNPNFWNLSQRERNLMVDNLYFELRNVTGTLEEVVEAEEVFLNIVNNYANINNARQLMVTPSIEIC